MFNPDRSDFADKANCTDPDPSDTNGDAYRAAILKCLAHAVHNLRAQAAEDALTEYRKWKVDPARFTPPAGFVYENPAMTQVGANASAFESASP